MNYPKVELHLHLDGAIPEDLICKYAKEEGMFPEGMSDEEYVKSHQMTDAMPLAEALKQFDFLLSLLLKPEHLTEVSYRILHDHYLQGVRICELRFAPQQHQPAMSMEEAVEAVIKGINQAKQEHPDLCCGVLLCMMVMGDATNYDDNKKTVELCKKYQNQGVIGLDLAGAEGSKPMASFGYLFDYAKELGVQFTAHACESCPAENVQYIIDKGATRVGHGVLCVTDDKVVENVIQSGITMEVSVTSNIFAKTFDSYDNHPVKRLLDAGAKININTDDPFLLDITLDSEYEMLKEKFNFTERDLILTNLYGAKASFCEGTKPYIEQLENLLR
ncbi:MAG: adenosine deaminase [Erysipelotrichaceae bacterium]|nr:adenosine deaminase [Erysipelotrichaceae bacterium]